MFGQVLGQPADLLLDPPRTDFVTVPRYAIYLKNTLRTAHNYASEQLGKSVATYKEFHERQVSGKPFSLGDVVWLLHIERHIGHSAQLEQRAIGTYLIVAKLGSNYRIAKAPDNPGKVVHYNRLRLCIGSILVSGLHVAPKYASKSTGTDDLVDPHTDKVPRDVSTLAGDSTSLQDDGTNSFVSRVWSTVSVMANGQFSDISRDSGIYSKFMLVCPSAWLYESASRRTKMLLPNTGRK